MRVRGRNGVYSLASPFTIDVTIQPGLCQNLDTDLVPGSLTATAGNFQTIILVDPSRMTGSPADINAMFAKLAQLAARPDVQGVVVNVSQDARVAAANLQADQKVECPEAKNLVAESIKSIVERYRSTQPARVRRDRRQRRGDPILPNGRSGLARKRNQLHPASIQQHPRRSPACGLGTC